MSNSYADYLVQTAPMWMRLWPAGRDIMEVFGARIDDIKKRYEEAVLSWIPGTCPDDAVELHAAPRLVVRAPDESVDKFRLRVSRAASLLKYGGTALSILQSLQSIGLTAAVITDAGQVTTIADGVVMLSTWLPTDPTPFRIKVVITGHPWSFTGVSTPGYIPDTDMTTSDAERVVRMIKPYAPSHIESHVLVVIRGKLWGYTETAPADYNAFVVDLGKQ